MCAAICPFAKGYLVAARALCRCGEVTGDQVGSRLHRGGEEIRIGGIGCHLIRLVAGDKIDVIILRSGHGDIDILLRGSEVNVLQHELQLCVSIRNILKERHIDLPSIVAFLLRSNRSLPHDLVVEVEVGFQRGQRYPTLILAVDGEGETVAKERGGRHILRSDHGVAIAARQRIIVAIIACGEAKDSHQRHAEYLECFHN